MHQTFYIDIDEEISSVIDRLNRSMSKDNYFVVPPRALFMQSVVNLKLLKREAEKSGKHITLVTQDEIGTSMAERSGISVRFTLDGLEPVSDVYQEDMTDDAEEEEYEYAENISGKNKMAVKISQDKQARLSSIGSSDFYGGESSVPQAKEKITKTITSTPRKIPVNTFNYSSKLGSSAKKTSIDQPKIVENKVYKKNQPDVERNQSANVNYDIFRRENPAMNDIDPRKERSLEKMFSSPVREQKRLPEMPIKRIGKKSKKMIFGFILLCLLVPAGVVAYLLVPSAKIIIMPNVSSSKMDANIHGAISGDVDAGNIPIRVIDETQDISATYTVTGKNASSGQKAHGTVVLYNEYSSSSQPLIATTRLQSADGKIFRLTKNIVVPGTTIVGGSSQPGAIEAEIIADQTGDEYNIDPTSFTVPGFSGGPKFDKFYAKSSATMAGGSSNGGSGPTIVSQQDIDNAKTKTEVALKDKINGAISDELKTGEVALPQAEKITRTKSSASAKVGDMLGSLDYTAQASVHVLVFSENDIKKIMTKSLTKDQNSKQEIIKIEYANASADFDNSTIELKILGGVKITPNIDTEQIKKEVLGKNSDQLGEIIRKYTSIKNANVEFQPAFISHVPQYAQRVDIQIDISE
jgi:hypothetical protein